MPSRFVATALLLFAIRLPASTLVGSLPQACTNPSATLLADGRVLVAGGYSDHSLNTAEIYNPGTRTFRPTSAPMNSSHSAPAAILLRDGRVLITGGVGAATTETYDPTTDQFTATAPPASLHLYAPLVMLNDGRVLVAGGTDELQNPTTLVEIFDPATNSWSSGGNLAFARFSHAAVPLPDGRILLAGGRGATAYPDSEIFDPVAKTSVVLPGTPFSQPIGAQLLDGRAAIVNTDALSVFDEVTQSFQLVRSSIPTSGQSMTLLHNGLLLLAGGEDSITGVTSPQVFIADADDGTLVPADTLQFARLAAASVVLDDGSVLIVGGEAGTQPLASAELFAPPPRRRAIQP